MDSTAAVWPLSSTVTRVWWPSRENRSGSGGLTFQAVRMAATRGSFTSGASARSTSARNAGSVTGRVLEPNTRWKASGRCGRSRFISMSAWPDSVSVGTKAVSKRPPWRMSQSDAPEDRTDRIRTVQR